MKAILCTKYGPPEVLKMGEVETPVPKDDELLIRIHATTVTAGDARIRGLNVPTGFGIMVRLMFGFTKPKHPILGMNFAGVVEKIGKDVTKYQVGDEVFGCSGMGQGTYAEYIVKRESSIICKKPESVSFEEAACTPFGGFTAINFLRDLGTVQKGEDVLVNGASGSVGTASVQIAKYFGAKVTGVCSTKNVELVKSLGADEVIDYKKENFTKQDKKYDIIVETIGSPTFSESRNSLKEQGRYLAIYSTLLQNYWRLHTKLFGTKKFIGGVAAETNADLELLAQLLESGKFNSVVSKTYMLDEIVEAHRHVDTGHKVGNIAIKVL